MIAATLSLLLAANGQYFGCLQTPKKGVDVTLTRHIKNNSSVSFGNRKKGGKWKPEDCCSSLLWDMPVKTSRLPDLLRVKRISTL